MTTVHLVSHTNDPLRTLAVLWEASRSREDLRSIWAGDPINRSVQQREDLRTLFRQFLDARIPLLENVSFTFVLENVPISLREQMVRHRIGVTVGDNFGVDIMPDLAQSTWWSQTMRVMDMGCFATNDDYYVPDLATESDEVYEVYDEYVKAMQDAEQHYRMLISLGMQKEDARQVIPLAATSRISWTLNGSALRHVLGNRSCWIAQYGLWWPVITGMLRELRKVDEVFGEIAAPPCFNARSFDGCKFMIETERRIKGLDPFPPCPLFMYHSRERAVGFEAVTGDCLWQPKPGKPYGAKWRCLEPKQEALCLSMQEQYRNVWPEYVGDYTSYCV